MSEPESPSSLIVDWITGLVLSVLDDHGYVKESDVQDMINDALQSGDVVASYGGELRVYGDDPEE